MIKTLSTLFCALALLVQPSSSQTTNSAFNGLSNPLVGLALVLSSGGMTSTEQTQMLQAINTFRQQNGKKPVTTNARLMMAALDHANEMGRLCKLDHKGADGASATERAKRRGFRGGEVYENIAAGQNDIAQVMQSWIDSPMHRANLLSDHPIVGFAKASGSATCNYKLWWSLAFADNDLGAFAELISLMKAFGTNNTQSAPAAGPVLATAAPPTEAPTAAPTPAPTPAPTDAPTIAPTTAAPAPVSSNNGMSASEQQEMLAAINSYRQENGKPALAVSPKLMDTANDHTVEMASRCDLDHAGADGSTPTDRALRHGFDGGVGENIAAGQQSVAEAMHSWINSAGHRENLLGNYQYVGFAKAGIPAGRECTYSMWWTQDFS